MNNVWKLPSALAVLFLFEISMHSSAVAQSLTGSVTNSDFQGGSGENSGSEGSDRILRRRLSEARALVGLTYAERGNDPCELTTRFRRLSDNAFFAGTGGFLDCPGNGTNSSRETVSLPPGFFVSGVRVCLNSNGTKVKGISLSGIRAHCVGLSVQDVLADPTCQTNVHHERQNCVGSNSGVVDQDWISSASCSRDSVAVGVQLSTRSAGGNRRMIDGIGLKCARVVQ